MVTCLLYSFIDNKNNADQQSIYIAKLNNLPFKYLQNGAINTERLYCDTSFHKFWDKLLDFDS